MCVGEGCIGGRECVCAVRSLCACLCDFMWLTMQNMPNILFLSTFCCRFGLVFCRQRVPSPPSFTSSFMSSLSFVATIEICQRLCNRQRCFFSLSVCVCVCGATVHCHIRFCCCPVPAAMAA